MRHITQMMDGFIHTLRNDSLSLTVWVGFAADTNIDNASICGSTVSDAVCASICSSASGMERSFSRWDGDISASNPFAGFGLYVFTYLLGSLFAQGNDCLKSDKKLAQQLVEQPAWGLSNRPVLEPKTAYRSRERRQLAVFSF